MTFADWLRKNWQRDGEAVTTALMRLSGEWGIAYKTLFYAQRGARVNPETARLIETKTSGALAAGDLVMLPKRDELRATSEEPAPAPTKGAA